MGNFYVRCEIITGYPSGDARVNVMRFIANSVMNAQGFTFEEKDIILSLHKVIFPGMFMK